MAPGQNMDDWWTILRSGMWRLYYKLSSEGKKRFYKEFLPLLHNTLHDVLGHRENDTYYLVYLGSKPSARGKGYAKKLIEHMTIRVSFSVCMSTTNWKYADVGTIQADLEGRATYLESSAEVNIAYYKKHHFVEKTVIALKRGPKPIKMHIMVREPQSGAECSKLKEQTVKIRAI